MEAWNAIEDRELVRRANGTLLRMRLLCEGPASGVFTRLENGLSAAEGGEDSAPTLQTPSLYEEWLPKFLAATTDKMLQSATLRAETELLRYIGKYRAERELPTDDNMAKEQVVAAYEGESPEEVVKRLASKVSIEWVRKARTQLRRDPKDGTPLKGWKGWSDERRREEAERAVRRGESLRKAAERLGVPPTSLHRDYGQIWARDAA